MFVSIQNGWPSQTSSGVQGNSPSAVASINSERVRAAYLVIASDHLILPDLELL